MTDPDETQPHRLADDIRDRDTFAPASTSDGAVVPNSSPPPDAGRQAPGSTAAGLPPEPSGMPPGPSGMPPGPSGAPPYDPSTAPRPAPSGQSDRPLRVDPDRPADPGWREPPWIPARARPRDRRPNIAALVVGFLLIAVGLYWFVDRTLGIALPRISWGSLWPIALIVVGGLILVRSLDRRT